MDTKVILEFLDEFKKLPTYQFERRIDPFLLPYIEKVFTAHFNGDAVKLIMPEFPILCLEKKNEIFTLKDDNKRAAYADYLLWCEKRTTLFLVELKTDNQTLHQSKDQLFRYLLNCEKGWEDLFMIYLNKAIANTKYKSKYVYGLRYLFVKDNRLVGLNEEMKFDEILGKKGKELITKLEEIKERVHFPKEIKLRTIYLAPQKSCLEIDDYKCSRDYLTTYLHKPSVSFKAFANSAIRSLSFLSGLFFWALFLHFL